jgi:hypothetical protein
MSFETVITLPCTKCHQDKPVSAYRRRPDRSANGKRLGMWSCCKACEKEYSITAHARANTNRRTKAFRNRMKQTNCTELRRRERASNLKRQYGISEEDYQALHEAQNGLCAICRRQPQKTRWKRLNVDHDHETGEIRGLLCGPCNVSIGGLCESPEILRRAADYLEMHKQARNP